MTVLAITPDYASHALPIITIADAWRQAGERVFIATGPAVAPLVEQAGMEVVHLSLGRGSNRGVARPDEQPPGEDDNLRAFIAATRSGMVGTLRYQAEARAGDLLWDPVANARRTLEIVDAVRPDTILVDHLAFGATIGLRAAAVPYADIVLGHPRQHPVAGEVYGVPGAWPRAITLDLAEMAALRRAALDVASAFTESYNAALNTISADAEPVEDAFAAHGPLLLYNYPQLLHDRRRTSSLPAAHAFLGATVRRDTPSAAVAAWLVRDAQRPLVLVSLGTFLSAREDVLAIIVDGLRRADVRVALAIGSADPAALGQIPADWLVGTYLPQVAILEHANALVTHAGNNSVTEALACGVPMLALPFSTDQFDGAAAIEQAGFGFAADPNTIDAMDVARAIERLVGNQNPALESLKGELRARPGPMVAKAASAEWLYPAQPVRTG
jgi:zeaxanthin glucosyltransferase